MKTVLSLGQCTFDHAQLDRAFRDLAKIIPVSDEKGALKLLEQKPFDLVLVNREFDEDGASGIEFIKNCIPLLNAKGIPAMLVSNFPEAQAQAINAGALAGFGKAELSTKKMAEVLARLG